jgi:dolichol-phosphate mannosyltransferase
MTKSSNVQADQTRVIIVLPVYNEEQHIAALLCQIDDAMRRDALPYQVIAIDDGSDDGTSLILGTQSKRLPLTIYRHEINQGLGRTIGDGLRIASKMASGHDAVITMDSDETHSPDLIAKMVRMIQQGHDVVIASRYQPGARVIGVSLMRRTLSYGASILFRLVFPTRGVRDFTCGYRAYRGGTLHRAVALFGDSFAATSGFECMVDILLTLRSLGVVFGEVPILLRYDLKQGASKMQIARTIRRSLAVLARHRFRGMLTGRVTEKPAG